MYKVLKEIMEESIQGKGAESAVSCLMVVFVA